MEMDAVLENSEVLSNPQWQTRSCSQILECCMDDSALENPSGLDLVGLTSGHLLNISCEILHLNLLLKQFRKAPFDYYTV